ncbi:ectoine synthase [Acetobacter garciniae]|uniref:ectoine synthase n=1 Tax=Acetobacter garciniae TaxID=2817435 RepID=UPI002EDA53FB
MRDISELRNTERFAAGPGWESTRLLLACDRMGFSLHETHVHPGQDLHLEYRHHLEANYCVGGEGEVVNCATGEVHPIYPGVLYALDRNDAHILRATTSTLRLICVFDPAVNGTERHVNGGYEPTPPEESEATASAEVPIIEQRRIEANILKQVYDTLVASHGEAVATQTLRDTVIRSAEQQGETMRKRFDHMPDLVDLKNVLALWTAEDALRLDVLQATPHELAFNVTRCRYAELYREMGLGALGGILSCSRDGTFCKGFNPAITFERSQTIMEGASHCDFRFTLEKDEG